MDEYICLNLFIKLHDPDDHSLIDQMTKELTDSTPEYVKASSVYKDKQKNSTTFELLDVIFSVTIAIMMFLCFFSLTAAMTANIYDQSKKIGVLRSIGLTKNRIRLLFFYEAAILVFAACLMGVLVGTTVGYTMLLQENLFMQTTL